MPASLEGIRRLDDRRRSRGLAVFSNPYVVESSLLQTLAELLVNYDLSIAVLDSFTPSTLPQELNNLLGNYPNSEARFVPAFSHGINVRGRLLARPFREWRFWSTFLLDELVRSDFVLLNAQSWAIERSLIARSHRKCFILHPGIMPRSQDALVYRGSAISQIARRLVAAQNSLSQRFVHAKLLKLLRGLTDSKGSGADVEMPPWILTGSLDQELHPGALCGRDRHRIVRFPNLAHQVAEPHVLLVLLSSGEQAPRSEAYAKYIAKVVFEEAKRHLIAEIVVRAHPRFPQKGFVRAMQRELKAGFSLDVSLSSDPLYEDASRARVVVAEESSAVLDLLELSPQIEILLMEDSGSDGGENLVLQRFIETDAVEKWRHSKDCLPRASKTIVDICSQ